METRRSLILKIPKMWDHASHKLRYEDDDFFEHKEALVTGVIDAGFPPRR